MGKRAWKEEKKDTSMSRMNNVEEEGNDGYPQKVERESLASARLNQTSKGTSLAAQWLRHMLPPQGGTGSIPGCGYEDPTGLVQVAKT